MEVIKLREEFIKLGQALKAVGFVESGVEAKDVIQNGLVLVNGEIDTRRGRKLYDGDIVEFDGQKIKIVKQLGSRDDSAAVANTEALQELPWTNEELINITAQVKNLAAVPNHPGSYYLQRYIDFAFLAAYNDGADPADALLSYVNTINKELTRKRQEFGMDVYED